MPFSFYTLEFLLSSQSKIYSGDRLVSFEAVSLCACGVCVCVCVHALVRGREDMEPLKSYNFMFLFFKISYCC